MLRTAFGAFDALLGGNAAQGRLARDITAKMGRVSAKASTVPWHQRALMSQLRAARPTATRPKLGQFKVKTTPFFRPRRPFHNTRPRRSDKASTDGKAASEEALSLSGRLKKLSREYGWTAVGVYLALSVLDFPFCFLLVRMVGTEKIAHLEEIVVSKVQKVIPDSVQTWWHNYRHSLQEARRERTGEAEVEVVGHGVEEAQERNKEGASLATQLALAYAIHKSFIFIRVPLTAAVTPKIVHVLRSWGWQIGKRKVKAPKKL